MQIHTFSGKSAKFREGICPPLIRYSVLDYIVYKATDKALFQPA